VLEALHDELARRRESMNVNQRALRDDFAPSDANPTRKRMASIRRRDHAYSLRHPEFADGRRVT
jgi:hypothetical protein